MDILKFKNEMGNVTFYDAVKLDGNGDAYLDIADARNIWMNVLRNHRNRKLLALDVESLKALENKDDAALAVVVSKKKVLRDMPQTYDLSGVSDWKELLNMWPEYLLPL